MKKTLCVIIAVVIALSSLTIMSFAASVPVFELKTSANTAKVGDRIKVDVAVGNNQSRICSLEINLVYDNACYKAISIIPAGLMDNPTCNLNFEKNKVRFVAVKQDLLQEKGTLFTVEFEVIKTGGAFSLEFDEVCVIRQLGGNDIEFITDDVKKEYEGKSVTVECAHAVKETTVTEEPTCTKAGSKTEKCTQCDWVSEATEIPALSHELEETIVKKATCTENGSKLQKCKKCDYKSEETPIPATGHTPEEWSVIAEATCTKDGTKVKLCGVCDAQLETAKIPAKGHSEGEWEVIKKPTTTEKGLEQKKCTACGIVLDEKEIPQLPPYKLGDVNEDGNITAVDARKILRYVAALDDLDETQQLAADVTGDGQIGATDARMILQYVVGKVSW